MLKTHRVRGDDLHGGRDLLEKSSAQPVCQRDEQGVRSFSRGEQPLLAERKLVRVSSGDVIAVDAFFNFLCITTRYYQNGFSHD